jgi:hypothetical protein
LTAKVVTELPNGKKQVYFLKVSHNPTLFGF